MKPRSEQPRSPSQGTPVQAGTFERMNTKSSRERDWEFGALALSFLLHFGWGSYAAMSLFDLGLFAESVRATVISQLEATIDLDEPEALDEPEPEPEPEEEEELDEEEPEPVEPPEPLPDQVEPTEEAPPAAAEAAEVLTSEPDPNEPLDLTDEGFITGTGTRYAGGITAANGTSKTAVRTRKARGNGIKGARGKTDNGSGPPPVDKSRPAGLPAGANWNSCGFPPEADAEQINQARVRVVVVVSADGKPTSVNVLSDPGYGFGRIARRCAMKFRYPPGLDKKGNPVARSTRPFAVTFTR